MMILILDLIFVCTYIIRWDGDFEAGIQQIRGGLKRVRRSMGTYFQHKLQYARRKRHLKIINEQFGDKREDNAFLDMLNPDDVQPKSRFYASFHRYDSIEDIQARLDDKLPLCGFYNSEKPGCVFVAYGNGRKAIEYARITYGHSAQRLCNGICFSNMKLDGSFFSVTKTEFTEECSGYCLLLPYIKMDETSGDQSMHCIVADNWTVVSADGSFSWPEYSDVLFQNFI